MSEKKKPKKNQHIVYVGRKVPKELVTQGWKEVSGMHIGHGCWFLRLERVTP